MAEIADLSDTDASNTARFPEGQAPSTLNNGSRALEGILSRWHNTINGSVATAGAADTYTWACPQTLSAYYDGLLICVDINATNTGAATINADSLGAKDIKKHNDQALAAGDLEAGGKYILAYDGTNFQLLSQSANAPSTYSDPLTTQGDVVIRGAATTDRLAIGAASTVLGTDGTDPSWGKVAVAMLATGTDGELITWDASGDPAVVAVGTATHVLTSNGAGAAPTFQANTNITRETAQATTSGTAFNYTGIAAGANRITIMLSGVSLSGTDNVIIQIGDSGGLETTAYVSTSHTGGGGSSSTAGFILYTATAARSMSGIMTLARVNGNTWVASHSARVDTNATIMGGGTKTLSAELDRLTITRTGANTFDAGQVNILIE